MKAFTVIISILLVGLVVESLFLIKFNQQGNEQLEINIKQEEIIGLLQTGKYGTSAKDLKSRDYGFPETNPNYPFFSGKNCANFVSQSLHAGGLEMNDAWTISERKGLNWIEGFFKKVYLKIHRKLSDSNHYYNASDKTFDVEVSDTWVNASAQYDYFKDPKNGYINGDVIKINSKNINEILQNLGDYNIQSADLLYWDWTSNGSIDHATVICSVTESDILYAGNSNTRFGVSFFDVFQDNYTCYVLRLNDSVFDDDDSD
jgi:hypothetical protein